MSKNTLTVTLHIGGKQVDSLTAEQCEGVAKRLTDAMCTYYTAHPDELANFKSRKESK